jgi:hypothetical protein
MASISSIKIIEGLHFLASSNSVFIHCLTPHHLVIFKFYVLQVNNCARLTFAHAYNKWVLPVPGAPYSSTSLQGILSLLNN